MKSNLLLILGLFIYSSVESQTFIGSGNTPVLITTSDNAAGTTGNNVINGKGLNANKYEAARFLQQSTFFFDEADITGLQNLAFSAWIDAEIAKPTTYVLPIHDAIFQEAKDLYYANGGSGDYYGPSDKHFHYAWWQTSMTADDQLRHRVAYALSQVLVISGQSDLGAFGEGISNYYDILLNGAFGNYRDLLYNMTVNPCMAFYLSSLNNRKTNGNIRPDENFAREIMQLFTIGLYELENNGDLKLDGNGNEIPTYDNLDIKEFAKVFTGLKGSAWANPNQSGTPGFGAGIYSISRTSPLVMHAAQHEPGIKYLLNGATTDSDGMTDINNALDNLFNHPNVGPFLAKRLIQRLVKSNPSSNYIGRVASVFNNNGSGVRGDMAAVVKQILMDDEARLGSAQLAGDAGMLREPMLKFAQVVGNVDKDNPSGNYWNNGFNFLEGTGQHAMQSPTVFNFYFPDYEPNNELSGLTSPEFQIFNTRTSINWMNYAHDWMVWGTLFWDWEGEYTENVYVDYTNYTNDAADIEGLINKLDLLFTSGTLSDYTRSQIRTAMNGMPNNAYNRARLALTLVISSPEFAVLH